MLFYFNCQAGDTEREREWERESGRERVGERGGRWGGAEEQRGRNR